MAKTEERSMVMQIVDILFIFVVAAICVVVPVIIQGTVLVGWDGTGSMQFVWDPVAYFGLLAVILTFFTVILYHSVKNYKY
ncbi:AcrB/AcrD/AcrF family protein [Methanococcoides sp. NM1]|uniref:AcrB/AcrD/AcrF family protein n=1 Tax=Methanococcoides sp. NM1 TaxID=1201013 RepID=UPI0010831B6E|nr:AcrB/AcrD/AcrF family protein [Methanococcoides sp. NM1]